MHYLRIAPKRGRFTVDDIMGVANAFDIIGHMRLIAGNLYARIPRHDRAVQILVKCFENGFTNSRLIDPFSLHFVVPRGAATRAIVEYFGAYGNVSSVSTKSKNFGFVNFMNIESTFQALENSSLLHVRSRVLSTREPVYPKPWSPARLSF